MTPYQNFVSENNETVKRMILGAVQDVAGDLFGKELDRGLVDTSLKDGVVTIEEMVAAFESSLRFHAKMPKPPL